MTYRQRLAALCEARGRLCVGIDPHPPQVSQWGLDVDVRGVERFSRDLVAALADQVAVFKPQSAFFEVWGAAGIEALSRVLADIRDAGALALLDVKRGDIGSTMAAYAQAYLAQGAPLSADAITVSPYLGFGALGPALDLAEQNGRGIYVLCRTSNPEGAEIQFATSEGHTVAQSIVTSAQDRNHSSGQDAVGLVVGATHDNLGVDLTGFTGSVLAPGIGAQGGRMDAIPELFGAASAQVLPSVSRDVASAGPDPQSLRERVTALLAAAPTDSAQS